jgi:glycosyltransferase involved in cell wall biosynthesis
MERIALLCNESAGRVDAIRDSTFCLAEALHRQGLAAHVWLRRAERKWSVAVVDGPSGPPGEAFDPRNYDAVVLQYNPFLFGKWGFAPWLPAKLWRWRRAADTQLALMVHEPYVPMLNWKWVLMGAWQRAQLEAARLGVDVVFASIEAWAGLLQARRPVRPTFHLPVGSNLPDRRDARVAARERLRITDTVVLASFGTNHPSRLPEYIVHAANDVSEAVGDVLLLNLGTGTLHGGSLSASVRLYEPGRLPEDDLATWLSAADLFLAPFADGVSTRRSSVMAALQHGLPVVGTDGYLTDGILRRSTAALRLFPVDRPDLFAEAVVELAKAPDERLAAARAARALYEASFDWPVLARRLLDGVTEKTRP